MEVIPWRHKKHRDEATTVKIQVASDVVICARFVRIPGATPALH